MRFGERESLIFIRGPADRIVGCVEEEVEEEEVEEEEDGLSFFSGTCPYLQRGEAGERGGEREKEREREELVQERRL